MKNVLLLSIVSVISLATANSYAGEHLFLHNNDTITLAAPGEDIVEFSYYSISGRSRVDVTCAGAGSGTKIFKKEDGWKEGVCHGGMATLAIRETGTNQPSKDSAGDIPGDSDVVIRFDDNYSESITRGHADDSQKGKKCPVCGKTLSY